MASLLIANHSNTYTTDCENVNLLTAAGEDKLMQDIVRKGQFY
jgi:hypothetical protein